MEIVLLWLGVAILTGLAASSRGRSGLGWFFIGILTGVFGLIAVLVMAPVAKAQEVVVPASPQASPGVTAKSRRLDLRAVATGQGYDVEVVGESHYQDALGRIVGDVPGETKSTKVQAILHPEPDNPYDPKAVKVIISGMQVGYLSRANAAAWVELLAQGGFDGKPVSVAAKVFSRRTDDGLGHGVWLDYDPDLPDVEIR